MKPKHGVKTLVNDNSIRKDFKEFFTSTFEDIYTKLEIKYQSEDMDSLIFALKTAEREGLPKIERIETNTNLNKDVILKDLIY